MRKRIVLAVAGGLVLGFGVLASMGQAGGLTNVFLKAIAADLNELTAAPVAETPVPLTAIVVTATGTPVPLIGAQTFATEIHLYAGRASAANTGLVTVGVGNAIRIATARQQVLAPGDSYIIRERDGKKIDMALFFVDAATNNDGLTGWYKP